MKDTTLGPGACEWMGVLYRTILSSADTNGAISIIDCVSPAGSGPPRHIHHDADETFVVLSGDTEFWLEGETHMRGPGEAIFIPKGREHCFRVLSTTPARHLTILGPGGFEAFFQKMAADALQIPQDMTVIKEIAQHHHLTFTGPSLAPELTEKLT